MMDLIIQALAGLGGIALGAVLLIAYYKWKGWW
jgi:hypothetical protein